MDKKGLHCLVTGHVQGVFYRAETQSKAQGLGLTGWAENLKNGQVEVFAFGKDEQLIILRDWLWEGSPAAHVERVEYNEVPWRDVEGFVVK